MRILLVWVSDSEENEWVDSCWTEDNQEAAIGRAIRFRDKGFNSAVIAQTLNHYSSMRNEWDDEYQETILQWEECGD